MTNLIDLITKNKEEISCYLEDVPVEEFIKDVKTLIKNTGDKETIKIAIKKLEELL